jgi:hypothetical protein
MSTFAAWMTERALDRKALLFASVSLEQHRVEDRRRRLGREALRRAGKASGPGAYLEAGVAKPRSGRPLSASMLDAAWAGKPLPQRVRAKLLRAVNLLLSRAGAAPVEVSVLFGRGPARHGEAARSDGAAAPSLSA